MAYRSKSERGQKAEQRLLADPYDTESWNVLLREAQVRLLQNCSMLDCEEGIVNLSCNVQIDANSVLALSI